MLRRLKDDVLKGVIKAKKEFVVRVELTPTQKKLYRAVLTANFPALSGAEGSKSKARAPALQNIVMQLRKVCNHVVAHAGQVPGRYDRCRFQRLVRVDGVNATSHATATASTRMPESLRRLHARVVPGDRVRPAQVVIGSRLCCKAVASSFTQIGCSSN